MLALLALVFAGVLMSGVPQAWLVSRMASQALGTRVEAEDVSLFHKVRAGAVYVYDAGAVAPTFSLHDIDVDVDLAADRIVRSVRVGTVAATIRAASDAYSNIRFLNAFLARPKDQPASARYLPQEISLESCVIDAELAEMGIVLEGLAVDATLGEEGRFAVEVTGEGIDGLHWFGTPDNVEPVENGSIDVFASRSAEGISVMANIALPAFIELDAEAATALDRGAWVWDIQVHTADMAGLALGGLEGIVVPTPVQFAQLTANNTRVRVRLGDRVSIPNATLDVVARDLWVGPASEPWYGGDLTVRGTASLTQQVAANVAVTFEAGQTATVVASGTVDSGTADVVIANWSRDDLLATVPPRYRARAEALPAFEGLSGNAAATWSGRDYTADVDVTTSGARETLALRTSGTGNMDSGPVFDGEVRLGIGTGVVEGTIAVASATALNADLTIADAKLNRWLNVVMGERAPKLPDAVVGGRAVVRSENLEESITADLNADLQSLSLGERTLTDESPLSVAAVVTWDRESSVLQAPAIAVDLPNRATLAFEKWRHDMKERRGTASVAAHLELDWLAVGELWGNVDGQGPVMYSATQAEGTLTFSTDTMGWGDFAIPYGQEISGTGAYTYRYDTRVLRLADIVASLDEGNTVQIDAGELTLSPLQGDLPAVLTTDLQPLVSLGLLERVEGTGTFTGTVTAGDSGMGARGEVNVKAATVVLPSERAELRDLELQSHVTFAGTLDGEGTFRAGAVTVSNATLTDVTSPVRWEEDALLIPEIRGGAYHGTATGSVRIGLLEEGRPLEASMAFERVDLEAFSDALAPDDFSMTGLAEGSASVSLRDSALTSVTLEAESTQGFSLSRTMVKKILESPRYAGMLGKQLDKALNTILGEAPQRPFDTARVSLALSGANELQGQAVLLSEKTNAYRGLDLTVDLTVPVAGLAELMALAAGE